jgi:hypothetical protein
MIKKLLITNIEPWAFENPNEIRTSAVSIQLNGDVLKAFASEKVDSSFIGKQVDAELRLSAFDTPLKKEVLPMMISKLNDNAEISLSGKVSSIKGPIVNKITQDEKEIVCEEFSIEVNCGIAVIGLKISKSKLQENNLKIGDYIEARGRLDIFFKVEKNEN